MSTDSYTAQDVKEAHLRGIQKSMFILAKHFSELIEQEGTLSLQTMKAMQSLQSKLQAEWQSEDRLSATSHRTPEGA